MRCCRGSVATIVMSVSLCHRVGCRALWSSGDEGADWKSRHLDERRSLASRMMCDVNRRKLITDSERQRCADNISRLRGCIAGQPNRGVFGVETSEAAEPVNDDEVLNDLAAALCAESSPDTTSAIPPADLEFLANELYGVEDTQEEDVLRHWMRLRRVSSSPYDSLPAEERTDWSAWYLRDVKPR